MAGHECYVVAQGPKLFSDRIQQRVVVAAGKVRAADAALEKHISTNDAGMSIVYKHHMTWSVARCMTDRQVELSEL